MKRKPVDRDEMRAEYDIDYSKAVRGKYYDRIRKEGSNVVLLDPDVAAAFPSSKAVNDALRALLGIMKTTRRATQRATGKARKRKSSGQ